MSILKSRLAAMTAFAVVFALATAQSAQAAAPSPKAATMLPLFGNESHNQPEAANRHNIQLARMQAVELERDIDTASAQITGLKYDDARQTTQGALDLATTLAKAPPAPVDGTARVRMADADGKLAAALKLMDQNRPWEAQEALHTARLDTQLFLGQPMG